MRPALLTLTLFFPGLVLAQTDISRFVAVTNAPGRVHLVWTNPAASSGFVVIRRADSPPTWSPSSPMPAPAVGAEVERGTFVIASVGSRYNLTPGDTGDFIDTGAVGRGLQAATRYYYKVYNTQQVPGTTTYQFSSGNVPTAHGVSVWPLDSQSAPLQWCYAVGLPHFARPVVQPGVRAMTIGQLGQLTSSAVVDGSETWRPLPLQAGQGGSSVQARPVYATVFAGAAGSPQVFTGDQAGFAYRIDASSGAEAWRRDSDQLFGVPAAPQTVPMPIAASPSAQFTGVTGSTIAQDLLFFGSRTGGTDNAVAALRGDGTRHWLYRPTGLADVLGEMMVDYANNRLWIPTTASTKSLRIVSTVTGAATSGPVGLPASPGMGPITRGIVVGDSIPDPAGGPADRLVLVASQTGVWAFRRSTMAYLWHVPLPAAPTAHVLPLQGGFIVGFGTGTGTLRRYRWTQDDPTVSPYQQGSDLVVPGTPSVLRPAAGTLVFSAGNTLYQVDGTLTVKGRYAPPSSGSLTAPQEDGTSRLVFGTADGRVCAVSLPLPAPAP
jgi:outer membrane protein assembly factor BamB